MCVCVCVCVLGGAVLQRIRCAVYVCVVCVCVVCARFPLKLRQELTDIALGLGRTAESVSGITTALRPALQQTGGGKP